MAIKAYELTNEEILISSIILVLSGMLYAMLTVFCTIFFPTVAVAFIFLGCPAALFVLVSVFLLIPQWICKKNEPVSGNSSSNILAKLDVNMPIIVALVTTGFWISLGIACLSATLCILFGVSHPLVFGITAAVFTVMFCIVATTLIAATCCHIAAKSASKNNKTTIVTDDDTTYTHDMKSQGSSNLQSRPKDPLQSQGNVDQWKFKPTFLKGFFSSIFFFWKINTTNHMDRELKYVEREISNGQM